MCCGFLQWITTFRRSIKWTKHNKHFVSTYWPNFQVPFHTFYVSTEDLPTCCGSPISLSSPRKSTMGKNVRSISFFVEEEVQEKVRKQSLCFVKRSKQSSTNRSNTASPESSSLKLVTMPWLQILQKELTTQQSSSSFPPLLAMYTATVECSTPIWRRNRACARTVYPSAFNPKDYRIPMETGVSRKIILRV